MSDLILFIDFMNYLHRCRVGELDGEYVLVFNFFRNLRATIEQFQPAKIFIVLDGRPKHRYELYAAYKANRIIKTASQIANIDKVFASAEVIKQLLLHMPVITLSHADFEADDIISSMVENIKEENIVVVSSDADYTQLLQKGYENCYVYNPIKKNYLVAPEYNFLAYRCLAGDKSDNIPALLKPKKALDTILNPQLFQKFLLLEENRANFNINRQLIEFQSVPEDDIIWQEGQRNFQFLYDAFKQMKFETIVRSQAWDRYIKTFNCLKY